MELFSEEPIRHHDEASLKQIFLENVLDKIQLAKNLQYFDIASRIITGTKKLVLSSDGSMIDLESVIAKSQLPLQNISNELNRSNVGFLNGVHEFIIPFEDFQYYPECSIDTIKINDITLSNFSSHYIRNNKPLRILTDSLGQIGGNYISFL
jgi:hypothetical protein